LEGFFKTPTAMDMGDELGIKLDYGIGESLNLHLKLQES
jgi:hypothetical protein